MRRIITTSGLALISAAALLALGCGGGGYGSNYNSGGGGGTGNIVSIVISPGSTSLTVGGMQQFTYVAKDVNGNQVTNASLNWASSNSAVASVDGNGLATAKAVGSAGITASVSYGGGVYSMPVTYTSNTATVTVTAMDMVMGTAAVGHALSGALVTLVDARGRSAETVSAADGRFQLSVAGLTAPFLLKADDGRGRVLFGAATQAGVANLDPMSDLELRAWYGAHGTTTTQAFAAHQIPDAHSLTLLDAQLVTQLQDTLAARGLDVAKFSLLSTPFNANSSGFDRVLDESSVDSSGGRLRFLDGVTHREIVFGIENWSVTLTTRELGTPGLATVTHVDLN